MAKIALTVGMGAAFAALGFFTFGLAIPIGFSLGMTIGGILGNVLFPTHPPNQFGPKINELAVSTAGDGAPIPIGYGICRFGGNIIWCPGIVEHSKTTKQSSKGGPSYKSTTYSYTASIAAAFGEGPGTVNKIWFDSKVVYQTAALANPVAPTITPNSTGGSTSYSYKVVARDGSGNHTAASPAGSTGAGAATLNGTNYNIVQWTPVIGAANYDVYRTSTGGSGGGGTTGLIGSFNSGTFAFNDTGFSGNGATPPASNTTASGSGNYPAPTLYPGNNTQFSQAPDPTIQATQGVRNTPAFLGICYAVWANFPLADFGNRIPNIQAQVNFGNSSFSGIVTDIATRCGLFSNTYGINLIDVSQIAGITCQGYLITRPMDARTALQNLCAAYFVDGVESDFKLKFIPRGAAASVLTIAENDLGLMADKAKLVEEMGQEQELPRTVEVLFIDPNADLQQNKTHKHRSSRIVKTKQKITMSLPIVMTPDQARQIAEKSLYLSYLERKPFNVNLWKATYMVLDPTDMCQFVYQGNTYTIRVKGSTIGVGNTIALSGVSEATAAYTSQATGGNSGNGSNNLPPATPTVLMLYDVPLLQDLDADDTITGYYFAMGSPNITWPGGVLYRSSNNSAFDAITSDPNNIFYGTVTSGALPAPASLWTWDTVNTLTVSMVNGTLSSSTDIDVLNGANCMIVGNEVIQYVNVTNNGNGSYTLSRLLRGRRNTEFACGTHIANETVIDPTTGIVRVPAPLSLIGLLRYYRGVTVGQDVTTVSSQTMTLQANDLKPASPVHITGTRDGSNNLTIAWIRRTRYSGDWLNNTGSVPLNETTEAYEIDIIVSGNPVRTITAFSLDGNGNPFASYTAAQQTADGITPGNPVTCNIYQISSRVGRGFPGNATI